MELLEAIYYFVTNSDVLTLFEWFKILYNENFDILKWRVGYTLLCFWLSVFKTAIQLMVFNFRSQKGFCIWLFLTLEMKQQFSLYGGHHCCSKDKIHNSFLVICSFCCGIGFRMKTVLRETVLSIIYKETRGDGRQVCLWGEVG